ncbi:MAG: serine/threonine-protein kinase PknK, partial [Candidatus Riflebacteria bacterium]|nr:serine/threonine-protein kinase PknK [Candidatus Riflebacteria bacterium]
MSDLAEQGAKRDAGGDPVRTARVCSACRARMPDDALECPACSRTIPPEAPEALTPAAIPAAPAAGAVPVRAEARFPPALASRFEVLELLGEGGMGAVFAVRDLRLGREVALKLLVAATPGVVAMFEEEARLLAGLEHDHVVRVYEFGQSDGVPYLVMELMRGWSLSTRLAEGRPTLVEAVRIAIDTLKGVAEAHRRGIVHRDLKPANIFVEESGRIKVADFGVAYRLASARDPGGSDQRRVVGTPGYMAPEQRRGEVAGPTADIYAVGVILHEMLTGQRLFPVVDLGAYLAAAELSVPPPSRINPSVPGGLDAVVERALAVDPGQRPDATALIAQLAEWLEQVHRGPSDPGKKGLPAHPYKFLAHYTAVDRAIFFGRDAEIAELCELIEGTAVRAVLVFGPCGIGKSSLLHAGVVPALDPDRFDPVVLVSGPDPARTLLDAISTRSAGGAPTGSPVDQLTTLARATGKTPVFVLDQLEELITLNARGARAIPDFFRLVELIVTAQVVPAKLILSFRTEFRGELYPLEEKLGRHQRSVAVREIRESSLIEVIEGPSRLSAYRFRYQDGFAAHLAGEVIR